MDSSCLLLQAKWRLITDESLHLPKNLLNIFAIAVPDCHEIAPAFAVSARVEDDTLDSRLLQALEIVG